MWSHYSVISRSLRREILNADDIWNLKKDLSGLPAVRDDRVGEALRPFEMTRPTQKQLCHFERMWEILWLFYMTKPGTTHPLIFLIHRIVFSFFSSLLTPHFLLFTRCPQSSILSPQSSALSTQSSVLFSPLSWLLTPHFYDSVLSPFFSTLLTPHSSLLRLSTQSFIWQHENKPEPQKKYETVTYL